MEFLFKKDTLLPHQKKPSKLQNSLMWKVAFMLWKHKCTLVEEEKVNDIWVQVIWQADLRAEYKFLNPPKKSETLHQKWLAITW
jgi:hypothetical protein